ncbi:MAG: FliA/WhiG family RNA polymerase sigma factor [Cytophagaceae bacterium]|nr:FliA/WhiG family RNA polymerase sigma factor [Gemmatimonadaceae bacterium]
MATATAVRRNDNAPELRQKLIGEHLGLVYHVARQLCRAKQMDVELDELVSAGTLGLIEAFNNFDTTRGLAFSTFAAPRIRGAMLDELRRQDHVPRSVRRRTRELNTATEALTRSLGRTPNQNQLADAMGVDLHALFRMQTESDHGRFIPLERTTEGTPSGSRIPMEHLIAATDDEVDERLTLTQEIDKMRDALVDLPDQERNVLGLYYFEELKLSEIATILGVSESRVSQIRAKAISRLRVSLRSLRDA